MPAYPATNAFNNVYTGTYCNHAFTNSSEGGAYIYFRPPGGISGITSIEVYADDTYCATAGFENNSTAFAWATVPPANPGAWTAIQNPPTSFDVMWFRANPAGGGSVGLRGLKINGELLLDPGVRNLGDSNVEFAADGGIGSIGTVDIANKTLLITNTGTANNRWIAENKANTKFYAAPESSTPVEKTEAFGQCTIVDNKLQVNGLLVSDPGYTPVAAKDYTVHFPARLL